MNAVILNSAQIQAGKKILILDKIRISLDGLLFKKGQARIILPQRDVLQTCYSRNICLVPTL